MRVVVVMLLTVACSSHPHGSDGGSGTPADARTTNPPPCPPAPQPQCRDSCGNGTIDTCYVPDTSHDACFFYYKQREICDGAQTTTSCVEQGYYGGTPRCAKTPVGVCVFDAKDCDVCATNASILDCESLTPAAPLAGFALAPTAGDPRLLAATGTPATLTIYEASATALTQVAQTQLGAPLHGVIGVPNGWLAFTHTSPGFVLRHIDASGVAAAALPVGVGTTFGTSLAYGPAARALVAWSDWDAAATTSRLWTAVVDASGAIVVAPSELVAAGTSAEHVSVATDGTSFFLATTRDGVLRRLDSNGVLVSSTPGFPTGLGVRVAWSGTIGWSLAISGSVLTAQRFDATGSLVGTPLQLTLDNPDVLPRGNELLVVAKGTSPISTLIKLVVQHVDVTGTVSASTELGVTSSLYTDPARLVAVGGNIAVAWPHGVSHEVALLTP